MTNWKRPQVHYPPFTAKNTRSTTIAIAISHIRQVSGNPQPLKTKMVRPQSLVAISLGEPNDGFRMDLSQLIEPCTPWQSHLIRSSTISFEIFFIYKNYEKINRSIETLQTDIILFLLKRFSIFYGSRKCHDRKCIVFFYYLSFN